MAPHQQIASFTGGGGSTEQGLIRKCSMLKVRDGGPELTAEYNEWHRKVWSELQAHIRRTGTTNCERCRPLTPLYDALTAPTPGP